MENVFLSGVMLGMPRRSINAKLDDIVAFAGAQDYVDTPVRTYSSGMLMRLGFSVAVHMEPDVLIVDEILAAGDEAFRRQVRERLHEETARGRVVLFASHYMEEVRLVCERVIWMAEGQAVRGGATAEVVDAYVRESLGDAGQSS